MVNYDLIANVLYAGVFITGACVINHYLIEREKYLDSLPVAEVLIIE